MQQIVLTVELHFLDLKTGLTPNTKDVDLTGKTPVTLEEEAALGFL